MTDKEPLPNKKVTKNSINSNAYIFFERFLRTFFNSEAISSILRNIMAVVGVIPILLLLNSGIYKQFLPILRTIFESPLFIPIAAVLTVIAVSYASILFSARLQENVQQRVQKLLTEIGRDASQMNRVITNITLHSESKEDDSDKSTLKAAANNQKDASDVELSLLRFSNLKENIEDEIRSLKSTATVNLMLGTFMFTICLLILAILQFIACDTKTPDRVASIMNSTTFLASKSIFSLSFAAFAFFFLTAYRNSVNQIRFYRNEATNVTSLSVAVLLSQSLDAKSRAKVVEHLLQGERNFVLKKGESTADIKLQEAQNHNFDTLMSTFLSGAKFGSDKGAK